MLRSLAMEDAATAALILQLQLDDLDEIDKRKERMSKVSDATTAQRLFREELLEAQLFINDLRMTQSIRSAVISDGVILSDMELQARLTAAEEDLQSRGIDSPAILQVSHQRDRANLDERTLAQLCSRYVAKPVPFLQNPSQGGALGKTVPPSCLRDNQGVRLEKRRVQWEDLGHEKKKPRIGEISEGRAKEAVAPTLRSVRDQQVQLPQYKLCSICNERQVSSLFAQLPCRHEYCQSCIRRLYEACMKDEQLYPPRCCRRPVVAETIQRFLSPDLLRRFNEKRLEYETQDRTYCAKPSCSRFISPRDFCGSQANCRACGSRTCTRCKAIFHQGPCTEDPGVKSVLDTARELGWQRCYSCRNVVELTFGCDHLTCRCGAEFCYRCGMKWKQCRCPLWDENRLIQRAQAIQNRQNRQILQDQQHQHNQQPPQPHQNQAIPGQMNPPGRIRPAQIPPVRNPPPRNPPNLQEIMRNLQDNEECDHPWWERADGEYECDICGEELDQYIWICDDCDLQACNRCHKNRV